MSELPHERRQTGVYDRMKLRNTCDIHTHTLFSKHAYSTIYENIREAAGQGLEVLGSADHFSAMLFTDFESCRNYQYLSCSKDWPREWMGITLLRGAEADIVDREGRLFGDDILVREGMTGDALRGGKPVSLYRWTTGKLDYVIASIHGRDFTRELSESQITQMYLNALSRPEVLMLGHIGRSALSFDVDEILRASKAMHKPVEINEHSFVMPGEGIVSRCRIIAERCAELDVPVVVSTDAHICCNVGRTGRALEMLESIGFPQELIATADRESFLKTLKEAVPSFSL